jgi:hypothetical protein
MASDQMGENPFASYFGDVWTLWLGALIFIGVGWYSLRLLRRLPDFPDKPAMLRGAKWGPLVVIAWCALAAALGGLCARSAGFRTSGPALVHAVRLAGFFWLLLRSGPEAEGLGFALTQFRLRPFDSDKWLAERERSKTGSRKWRWVLYVLAAIVVSGWVALAGWTYWHEDRWLAAMAQDERFGAQLREAMGVSEVEGISADGPAETRGRLCALFVHVSPGTAVERGKEIAERAREVLAARQDKHILRIHVGPEHGRRLAKVYYVPEGMTLPPDADNYYSRERFR